MSSPNIFSCIWIALFFEILFRALSGVFKRSQSIENAPNVDDTGFVKENGKANFDIKPRKSNCFYKKCKRGLAGLSEDFKSMFGQKEDVVTNAGPSDDPLVAEEGLKREDTLVSGGSVKVSSYYNQDGNMVFQRETVLAPPTVNSVNSGTLGSDNPSFFIKPQETSSQGINTVDEHIDKAFGEIYGARKELADSQRSFIDEHIDKTFKDVYEAILPSVY